MKVCAPQLWQTPVVVRVRPRTGRRWVRGISAVTIAGYVALGAIAVEAMPAHSDVQLATTDAIDSSSALPVTATISVGLTLFDGADPFDRIDGPGLDAGPSNGVVRQGDPVTYVVDIGAGSRPLADVVIHLPVPWELSLAAVPEFCGAGSGIDGDGLHCAVATVPGGSNLTRTVTMSARPGPMTDQVVSIAAVVTDDIEMLRGRSNEVAVRITSAAGVCDPYGVPMSGQDVAADNPMVPPDSRTGASETDPVPANGRISGLVTSGEAEAVTIVGADRCGHSIVCSVPPFQGRFSFVGLLPGTYRLTVDGRAPVQVVLWPGAMTVNGLTF